MANNPPAGSLSAQSARGGIRPSSLPGSISNGRLTRTRSERARIAAAERAALERSLADARRQGERRQRERQAFERTLADIQRQAQTRPATVTVRSTPRPSDQPSLTRQSAAVTQPARLSRISPPSTPSALQAKRVSEQPSRAAQRARIAAAEQRARERSLQDAKRETVQKREQQALQRSLRDVKGEAQKRRVQEQARQFRQFEREQALPAQQRTSAFSTGLTSKLFAQEPGLSSLDRQIQQVEQELERTPFKAQFSLFASEQSKKRARLQDELKALKVKRNLQKGSARIEQLERKARSLNTQRNAGPYITNRDQNGKAQKQQKPSFDVPRVVSPKLDDSSSDVVIGFPDFHDKKVTTSDIKKLSLSERFERQRLLARRKFAGEGLDKFFIDILVGAGASAAALAAAPSVAVPAIGALSVAGLFKSGKSIRERLKGAQDLDKIFALEGPVVVADIAGLTGAGFAAKPALPTTLVQRARAFKLGRQLKPEDRVLLSDILTVEEGIRGVKSSIEKSIDLRIPERIRSVSKTVRKVIEQEPDAVVFGSAVVPSQTPTPPEVFLGRTLKDVDLFVKDPVATTQRFEVALRKRGFKAAEDGTGIIDPFGGHALDIKAFKTKAKDLQAFPEAERPGESPLGSIWDNLNAFDIGSIRQVRLEQQTRAKLASLSGVKKGKLGPPPHRAVKDIGDAIRQSEFLLAEVTKQIGAGPFRRAKTARAKAALERLKKSELAKEALKQTQKRELKITIRRSPPQRTRRSVVPSTSPTVTVFSSKVSSRLSNAQSALDSELNSALGKSGFESPSPERKSPGKKSPGRPSAPVSKIPSITVPSISPPSVSPPRVSPPSKSPPSKSPPKSPPSPSPISPPGSPSLAFTRRFIDLPSPLKIRKSRIPGFKRRADRRKRKQAGLDLKKRFAPSLIAIVKDIWIPKAPKIVTGFGVRGILPDIQIPGIIGFGRPVRKKRAVRRTKRRTVKRRKR